MKTKAQLQQDLNKVDNLIDRIILGERVRKFSIGSGDFINTYEYDEITYDMLMKLRLRILQDLAAVCPTLVKFKQSSVPLIVTRCG